MRVLQYSPVKEHCQQLLLCSCVLYEGAPKFKQGDIQNEVAVLLPITGIAEVEKI